MSGKEVMIGEKPLSSLRVVDLKEELEKRGLSKSGSKKDLAERLRANVLLEMSQQQSAAADEELPNISMQEKLAEQNPFIRDYFASQAEMFHSQKLQKQLIEEEQLRESEASAPSADESEDKGLNSSSESAGGKVKKLARRFENQVTDKENSEPSKTTEPLPEKVVTEDEKHEEKLEEKLEDKIEDKPEEEARPGESEESSSSSSADEAEDNELDKNTANGNVPELAKRFENHTPEKETLEPAKSVESSPEKADSKPAERAENDDEDVQSRESESEASSSSEDEVEEDKVNNKSESVVQKVTELAKKFENQATEKESSEPPKSAEPSPEKLVVTDVVEKRKEVEHGAGTVRKLTEQFEKKGKEDLNETGKIEAQESTPKIKEIKVSTLKTETVEEKRATEAPKRKLITAPDTSEPKSRPEVPKQRRVSTRLSEILKTDDIQDDDVLDYGEEEKLKSEPAKFDWTRRMLRLKNKHEGKEQERKWQKEVTNKVVGNLTTDCLNEWFPEVKLVSVADLRLEEKERPPPDDDKFKITRTFSTESDKPIIPKMENITITRKVSLVPMVPTPTEENADKELSPPRHPASDLILITNLTRPFTLPQLKELLQRTGTLEDLWVDKIKSKCIVKYAKEDEAFETRAALHGVNWPQSNPKSLHVDYTTQERLEDYKSRDNGDVKPSIVDKPVTAETLPVREWDQGKRGKSRSPNRTRRRSRSVSRDRKRPRRSTSPQRRRGSRSPYGDRRGRGDVKEPEPLGKALDELFRKTTVTPSIYWLPLTPQQIAEKEELRRKRMVERERRLVELSKIRPR